MPTKKHAVVVLPTYNEKETILPLLTSILKIERKLVDTKLSVVVVDDSSPDGTGMLAREYSKINKNVHVLTGQKAGLGVAYIRGFAYALHTLEADIIVEMDADFSHDPLDLPRLISRAVAPKAFVIGSRYVDGGSIPTDWPVLRVMNSKIANLVTRYVAGIRGIEDCTGGFRAINAELLRSIDLYRIGASGYSFQINLLQAAIDQGARVIEEPIHFIDRTTGESKMRLFDIVEFLWNAVKLRVRPFTQATQPLHRYGTEVALGSLAALLVVGSTLVVTGVIAFKTIAMGVFLFLSLLITIQGLFTLIGLLYAWEEPKRLEQNRSPKMFVPPQYSFTALIPALHEEQVIGTTIRAVAAIDYPEKLKEILVICREDDKGTIEAATEAIREIGRENIKLIIPHFKPRNKPDKLNFALEYATKDVVCVFDAEDSPHQDLYKVVNTVMVRDNADVVQSGVQLVNFRSNWFSTLNVLEYFFWFKSVLHYFARKQVIPLGGNTVFFKKHWLEKVNGWDADCLTEDADVGIKLSSAGANIRIIYDEEHATQEETPPSLSSFVKQRTRWNQGFLQVYKKKEWKQLPKFTQRLLVAYILIWPEVQAFLFLYVMLSLVMMFTVKLPILLTLLSLLPLYLLMIHFVVLNVGLYEFTKKYGMKYPWYMPMKVGLTFIPFQLLLGVSAVRAVYRELAKQTTWEKTEHVNAHRPVPAASPRGLRSTTPNL
ncbi:MAG TPA: glycosyltransferase [Candidatus Kapabacteria bacterium]|nr:glycosyltransferase [Candidatus Kapabacteria bacterium]